MKIAVTDIKSHGSQTFNLGTCELCFGTQDHDVFELTFDFDINGEHHQVQQVNYEDHGYGFYEFVYIDNFIKFAKEVSEIEYPDIVFTDDDEIVDEPELWGGKVYVHNLGKKQDLELIALSLMRSYEKDENPYYNLKNSPKRMLDWPPF